MDKVGDGFTPWQYRFIIACLVAAWLITSGCYTDKKAATQVRKAIDLRPAVAAKITRDAFPCIVTASDTVTSFRDSLIYIECPDVSNGTAGDYLGKDTVYNTVVKDKVITRTVRVPVNVPIRTVTVIQKIKDSAEIFLIQDAYNKLQGSYQALQERCDQVEASRGKWRKLAVVTWVLLFIGAILYKVVSDFRRPLKLIK